MTCGVSNGLKAAVNVIKLIRKILSDGLAPGQVRAVKWGNIPCNR
jgi:hypothetical protein